MIQSINANLSGDKIFSSSSEAFSLYEKSLIGEKISGRIEYSSPEALYLISMKKIVLLSSGKKISEETLLKKLKKKDKKIETKFAVFSDLRKKGYIVKTALKYGAEFRVYDKGYRPGESHARWILFTAKESDALNWYDFAAKTRIAHSTKKNLLIGIVDEEASVTYYEISWVKP